MPTGYTAKLMEHGQEFNEFVLSCSRAMGACIMLRDHSGDVLPTEENVSSESTYYAKSLEDAQAKLETLESMSDLELRIYGEEIRQQSISERLKWKEKALEENRRIDEMLTKVMRWIPWVIEFRRIEQ